MVARNVHSIFFLKFLASGVTVAILLLFRRPNGHKYMESNAYRVQLAHKNDDLDKFLVHVLVQLAHKNDDLDNFTLWYRDCARSLRGGHLCVTRLGRGADCLRMWDTRLATQYSRKDCGRRSWNKCSDMGTNWLRCCRFNAYYFTVFL